MLLGGSVVESQPKWNSRTSFSKNWASSECDVRKKLLTKFGADVLAFKVAGTVPPTPNSGENAWRPYSP